LLRLLLPTALATLRPTLSGGCGRTSELSVLVVFWFVGPFGGHSEVVGLPWRELGQLSAHVFQVQAGDLLV